MRYRAFGLAAAIVCGLAVKSAEAQERWQGAYGGLSFSLQEAETSVKGSGVHSYDETSLSLGILGGFNAVRPSGFFWGPDFVLNALPKDGERRDAAVGSTKMEGSFLLSPRLRLGYATETTLFYGLLGVGISDLGVKRANEGGTDIVIGGAWGVGVEFATGARWSARIEAARYNLDVDDRNFDVGDRDVSGEVSQLTFAMTRKF